MRARSSYFGSVVRGPVSLGLLVALVFAGSAASAEEYFRLDLGTLGAWEPGCHVEYWSAASGFIQRGYTGKLEVEISKPGTFSHYDHVLGRSERLTTDGVAHERVPTLERTVKAATHVRFSMFGATSRWFTPHDFAYGVPPGALFTYFHGHGVTVHNDGLPASFKFYRRR